MKKKGSKKKKNVFFDDSEDKNSDEEQISKKFSKAHGTCGHTTDDYSRLIP